MQFVNLAGRLAKDAEVRFTADGTKVTNLLLVTNYRKAGQEESIWWRVSLWGDRWDKLVPYLTKGKVLLVGGEMRKPEIYTDKNGQPQVGTIDIMGEYVRFTPGTKTDQPGGEQGASAAPQAQSAQPSYGQGAQSGAAQPASGQSADIAQGGANEDELPF